MSLSYSAARTFVPLLSRLVLAAAFIPAGWDKFMGQPHTYLGREAQILRQLGLGEGDDQAAVGPQDGSPRPANERVMASYRQAAGGSQTGTGNQAGGGTGSQPATGSLADKLRQPVSQPAGSQPQPQNPAPKEPATPPPAPHPAAPQPAATPPAPEPAPPAPAPDPPKPVATPAAPAEPADDPPPAGSVQARRLYQDAVRLVEAGWGPPDMPGWIPLWLARIGAFLQLAGAGLLAVGLFARAWALGLATLVAISFFPHIGALAYGLTPLEADQHALMFSHVALLALALGVMLTGAGGLSIDRIIFRSEDGIDDNLV